MAFGVLAAEAHSAGTTQAAAGVPGEGNCTSCHTVGPIGTGNVTIAFPNNGTYLPGVKQHLKITITDSTAKRWGFQLTARLISNYQVMGGSFTPGTDSQLFCTQILASNYSLNTAPPCPAQQPLAYPEQTFDGRHINLTTAVGSITYELDWLPPADANAGNIIFFVSALASNNDGAVIGDITYNNRYIATPAVQPTNPIISSIVNVAGIPSTFTMGSRMYIQGSGLATTSRNLGQADLINGQFPQTVDGVSVTIAGAPALITAVDPGQLRVIVPDTTQAANPAAGSALGLWDVIVTNAGNASAAYQADLEPVAPAPFLWGSSKYTQVYHADGSAVGPVGLNPNGLASAPAAPGELVTIFATGLGVTSPAVTPGVPAPSDIIANLLETPLVLIGGKWAPTSSAMLVPGTVGVYAVTVNVPNDATSGDQSIALQVSGVQSDPGPCITVKQ